ncbi:MAG TPA: helix-turn-helix transcriptional regulator [Bacteroidia bacterium]|nr:helix-turn-helix transcriptional regulator [Bacteroidia bacterium]
MAKKQETPNELNLIGERLKELRKLKGFSNYEHIAFELGMSRSAYWRIESGENFEIKTLIKICKVLGITMKEFFEGIDFPRPVKKRK